METTISPSDASTPHLHKIAEFKAAIEHYHVNENAQAVLNETTLVLLVGPSSSGRNTIIQHLLDSGRYHFIISDTTRPKRYNNGILETNGKEYWFRSEEDMLADIKKGEYLEAEVLFSQQVSGISIRELRKAQQEQRIAIGDVDIGGINNIMHAKPDTISIMVLPPSYEVWRERLDKRGTMSIEEIRRRFETACRIFASAVDNRFVIVVNDEFEHSIVRLRHIVEEGIIDNAEQARGRALAEQLLAKTQAFLKTLG